MHLPKSGHIPSLLVCLVFATGSLSAQNLRSNSAAAYFERGNEHFKKGEFNKAIEDYTVAILFAPKSPEIKGNLG
jgi:hypothetical protein